MTTKRNVALDVVIMVLTMLNFASMFYTHHKTQQTRHATCVNDAYWTCRTTLKWPTAECDEKAERMCR